MVIFNLFDKKKNQILKGPLDPQKKVPAHIGILTKLKPGVCWLQCSSIYQIQNLRQSLGSAKSNFRFVNLYWSSFVRQKSSSKSNHVIFPSYDDESIYCNFQTRLAHILKFLHSETIQTWILSWFQQNSKFLKSSFFNLYFFASLFSFRI